MSESFEEFTERFLLDLKSNFKDDGVFRSNITPNVIKVGICFECWEEIDFKFIHKICIDSSKIFKTEFFNFNINDLPFFIFIPQKRKLTIKWFVESWNKKNANILLKA